jgi:hypothetical protein
LWQEDKAKGKEVNCINCKFHKPTGIDLDVHPDGSLLFVWCRRYPTHKKMPVDHWCGEYLELPKPPVKRKRKPKGK